MYVAAGLSGICLDAKRAGRGRGRVEDINAQCSQPRLPIIRDEKFKYNAFDGYDQ